MCQSALFRIDADQRHSIPCLFRSITVCSSRGIAETAHAALAMLSLKIVVVEL